MNNSTFRMKVAIVLLLMLIVISTADAQNTRTRPSNRFIGVTRFPLPPIRTRDSFVGGLDDDALPADDEQFRRPISNSLLTGEDDKRAFRGEPVSLVRLRSPQYQPFLLQGLSRNQIRFVNRHPQAFVPFLSHNIFPNNQVSRTPVSNFLPNSVQNTRSRGRGRRIRTRDRQRATVFFTRGPARPTSAPVQVYTSGPRGINRIQASFDYDAINGFGVDFDFFRNSKLNFDRAPRTRIRNSVSTNVANANAARGPRTRPRQRSRPVSVPVRTGVSESTPFVPRRRQRTGRRNRIRQHQTNVVRTDRPPRQRPRVPFVRINQQDNHVARAPPIAVFSPTSEIGSDDRFEENAPEAPPRRQTFTIFNDEFHFGDILKTSALKKANKAKKVEAKKETPSNRIKEPEAPVRARPGARRRVHLRTQIRPTRRPEVVLRPVTQAMLPRAITPRTTPRSRVPLRPTYRSRSRFARRRRLRIDANPTNNPVNLIDGSRRRLNRAPELPSRQEEQSVFTGEIQTAQGFTSNPRINPPPSREHPARFHLRARNRHEIRKAPPAEIDVERPKPHPTTRRKKPAFDDDSSFLASSRVKGIPVDTDGDGSPGTAGVEYPIYSKIPRTSFMCEDQKSLGYYADPEAQCQVFHFCQARGVKTSFLCPNGTLYNQEKFACEWWYNVNCQDSQSHYRVNDRLYKDPSEDDNDGFV